MGVKDCIRYMSPYVLRNHEENATNRALRWNKSTGRSMERILPHISTRLNDERISSKSMTRE